MKGTEKDIAISDLVYKSLNSELSEDEKVLLDCWLKDEENRKFYEEILRPEKLFEEMQEMAKLDTGIYYHRIQRKMNHKRRLRFGLAVASIAAVLVLLLGIVWPFHTGEVVNPGISDPMVQYSLVDQTILRTVEGEVYVLDDSIREIHPGGMVQKSSAGRQKNQNPVEDIEYNLLSTSSRGNIEVTLADGTKVWLNAGSRLRYPNRFSAERREVELTGEAYFEVARNEYQPFIVKADNAQVEVLGTQFNVNAKAGKSCVTTLVQGCVKVRNKVNDTVVIYPGQQVDALSGGAMLVKSVDPRFFTAWKRNRFAFQNKTLYQMMDELAEWYGFTFEFSCPRLADLHFTTIIPRYDDIAQVLGILQATREFGFIQTGQHIYITDYEQVN